MTNNKSKDFSAEYQEIAKFAKALSHPARIAIIKVLAEKKEIKAGNISDFLPISRTTVSQHLKELKSAGIINGNIDGLKIHYCLNEEKLKLIKQLIGDLIDGSVSNFKCSC